MRKIEGILATPRVSRNKNFYFPEELARGHNVTVPLRWEHIQENDGIIGKSTLFWDENLMQLRYKAIVDNAQVERLLENKKFFTSLGVQAESHGQICHGSGNCYTVPNRVKFREMSIVSDAGIPESTINLIESFQTNESVMFDEQSREFKIDDIKTENTSSKDDTDKEKVMSGETSITNKEDTTVQVKSTEPETPVAPQAPAQVVVPTASVAPAASEAVCDCKKPEEPAKTESVDIEKLVAERVNAKIEALQKEIRENYQPKAEVKESVTYALDSEESVQKQVDLMERVLSGESISIKLDKEAFIKEHTAYIQSPFQEAVSTSGTISGVQLGTQIVILPSGIKVKPMRQWLQVKFIPQGDDTVRFYTLDVPAFGNITEHVSTEITPATTTLTGIDVTANTVRGFRQNVLKSEVEKYPRDLLEKIRETARIRSVEDEASNVLITIAASDAVDFGANHFRADTGVLCADTIAEDAAAEFLAVGVESAKQRLEEQGHDPENGAAVLALTPRANKNLIKDPALVRYIQQGDASITRQGRMAMYFGVEIWVTNTIRTANNASRNILFMKGVTFGLAVGRDLELEFDKNINRQSVDIVATHRVNSVILDPTAYCILSSKAD